jgi:hypothetical protein
MELDVHAVLGEQAEAGRNGQRSRIGESQKADAEWSRVRRADTCRNGRHGRHVRWNYFSRRCASLRGWLNYCCSNNSLQE